MKSITFLCILILLVIAGCYLSNQKALNTTTEGFLSGTDVQLLTSKPYYTWYDYLTQASRYPYYNNYPYYGQFYRRPYGRYYGYPYSGYRYYNYGFSPYYKPTYY